MKELFVRVKTHPWIRQHQSLIMKGGLIGLFLLLFLIMLLSKHGEKEVPAWENKENRESVAATQEEEEKETTIIVDVSGAVSQSGIVELKTKSRVADAIDAAGGLKEDADISSINRASILEDGDKLYIPTQDESKENSQVLPESVSNDKNKVNLNTATGSELEEIKGVGPATAEKILIYRGKHGAFTSIEEVMNVDGIGEKTFEQMKDFIMI